MKLQQSQLHWLWSFIAGIQTLWKELSGSSKSCNAGCEFENQTHASFRVKDEHNLANISKRAAPVCQCEPNMNPKCIMRMDLERISCQLPRNHTTNMMRASGQFVAFVWAGGKTLSYCGVVSRVAVSTVIGPANTQKVENSNFRLFEFSNFRIFEFSSSRNFEFSNFRIFIFLNFRILELFNVRLFEFLNV